MNFLATEHDNLIVTEDTYCLFLPFESYDNLLSTRANFILGERANHLKNNFKVFEKWDTA